MYMAWWKILTLIPALIELITESRRKKREQEARLKREEMKLKAELENKKKDKDREFKPFEF